GAEACCTPPPAGGGLLDGGIVLLGVSAAAGLSDIACVHPRAPGRPEVGVGVRCLLPTGGGAAQWELIGPGVFPTTAASTQGTATTIPHAREPLPPCTSRPRGSTWRRSRG